MLIKELIKILKRFPRDAEVKIKQFNERNDYEVTAAWDVETGKWTVLLTPVLSRTGDCNEQTVETMG